MVFNIGYPLVSPVGLKNTQMFKVDLKDSNSAGLEWCS